MLKDFRILCAQGIFTNKGIFRKNILELSKRYYENYPYMPHNVRASLALFNALGADRAMVGHFHFYSGLETDTFLKISEKVSQTLTTTGKKRKSRDPFNYLDFMETSKKNKKIKIEESQAKENDAAKEAKKLTLRLLNTKEVLNNPELSSLCMNILTQIDIIQGDSSKYAANSNGSSLMNESANSNVKTNTNPSTSSFGGITPKQFFGNM